MGSQRRTLRARFAGVVADGAGALEVRADNTRGVWSTHAALSEADVAFLVVPRSSLLVVDLDLDTSDGHSDMDRARLAAFDELVAAAPAAVVCASGTEGNRHAFVPVDDDPASFEALCAQLRARRLDVRVRGVRPPLARHRRGGRSVPLGVSLRVALEVLSTAAPRGTCRHLADTFDVPRLSAQMLDLVRRGPLDRYQSASEARCAFACAVRGAGLPRSYLAAALADPKNALGASFRARPPRWRERELDRLVTLADERVRADVGPRRWASDLSSWKEKVAAAPWRGMSGGTDLAVLEAFAHRCEPRRRTRVSFSLDDVALAAGVSRSTARRSLRRLIAAGWLRRICAPTASTAAVYQLVVPATGPPSQPAASNAAGLGSDLARWRGLGKSAFRALRELSSAETSTERIAQVLAVSAQAARRHLRRLVRLGLAARGRSGWVRTERDSMVVAARLGVLGRSAAHEDEVVASRRARAARLRSLVSRNGVPHTKDPPHPHCRT